MSWNNKVVWAEGLFLQPQHFQQHDRYFERLVESRTAPLLGYSWGFVSLELNPQRLGNWQSPVDCRTRHFPGWHAVRLSP